jgi:hypothetical protein
MKLLRLPLVLLWVGFAQVPTAPATPHDPEQATSRPEQKSSPDFDVAAIQRKGMIKADHKKNLEDATALLKLAEELKSDLEKEDPLIISVKDIRETEDIQKLAKNIHGRLKRY